ncbi:uncharacterized protein [Mytilus edulis]|uniref:uncharacterized protein n=1 Tax=Mytilus edulis TaxID=6550 RepID=UPI0039EE82B4
MDLKKLKSIRSGNRSAVTKLIRKIDAAKHDIDFDPEELTATFDNLIQKQKLLNNLNEQILNLTEAEDIEDEILDSDEYCINLETKIRHIRNFIQDTHTASQSRQSETSSQILNVEHQPFVTANLTENSCTQPFQNPFSQASNTVSTNINPYTSASSQNHYLPKLTLPIFTGNILDWQTFWDSYECAIHLNPSLTDVQKFNYLKAQLQNEALRTIAGFALTNANYADAIILLKERFGQTHKITQAYMQALLEITPPRNNLVSLRHFYDQMETYVRGLESLGQSQDSYGTLLVPIILNKLPGEIKKNLAREHGTENWLLRDLRKSICNEINIIDAGQDTETYNNLPSASSFFTGTKWIKPPNQTLDTRHTHQNLQYKPCVFCHDLHAPAHCTNVSDLETRMDIVKREQLCFNCLGTHRIHECYSNQFCRICNKRHHTSLCIDNPFNSNIVHDNDTSRHIQQNANDSPQNTNFPISNGHLQNSPNLNQTSVNIVNDTNQKEEDTTILHSSSNDVRTHVLLKTAVAPVWSDNLCIDTHILFDEGSQRSFVTEDLARKLNLHTEGIEILQLSSFGDRNKNVRHLDKSTVFVESNAGQKIPIHVLIVPMIAVPLQNNIRHINRGLNYLRGLKLAHPVTQEESFEISLLIGADYYWDLVENEVVRGNGPTAVKSKLGFLLSGSIRDKSEHALICTNILSILVSHKPEEHDIKTSLNTTNRSTQSRRLASAKVRKKIRKRTNYQS